MSLYATDRPLQYESMNTTDEEKTTTLSQETRLKIEELKRLVYKYTQYHRNPGAVIQAEVDRVAEVLLANGESDFNAVIMLDSRICRRISRSPDTNEYFQISRDKLYSCY